MKARQNSTHLTMGLVRSWDSPQGTGVRTVSSKASVKRQYVCQAVCVIVTYSYLRIKEPPEKGLGIAPNGVK